MLPKVRKSWKKLGIPSIWFSAISEIYYIKFTEITEIFYVTFRYIYLNVHGMLLPGYAEKSPTAEKKVG